MENQSVLPRIILTGIVATVFLVIVFGLPGSRGMAARLRPIVRAENILNHSFLVGMAALRDHPERKDQILVGMREEIIPGFKREHEALLRVVEQGTDDRKERVLMERMKNASNLRLEVYTRIVLEMGQPTPDEARVREAEAMLQLAQDQVDEP